MSGLLPVEEEAEAVEEPEGIEDSKKTSQHDKSSNELTESGAACTGPARVCTRSSVYRLWLPV